MGGGIMSDTKYSSISIECVICGKKLTKDYSYADGSDYRLPNGFHCDFCGIKYVQLPRKYDE